MTRGSISSFFAVAATAAVLFTLPMLAACEDTPEASPGAGEGFAIYLLADEVRTADLPTLAHLPLQTAPLLSQSDVVSYARATHEIELTPAAYLNVRAVTAPLDGRPFAVCVDGSPVYAGAFMTPISSMSCPEVIIMQQLGSELSLEPYTIALQLGYPGPDFYQGQDPRADPAVLQALEQAGKLK